MRRLGIWLAATRLKTLPAAVVPVVMGTALAWQKDAFHPLAALAAFMGAMLIQIGTNFANDYFDFQKGADTEDRLGPTRATAAGLVSPAEMKRAFITIFALSALVGLYLIYRGGWPILCIGVLSIGSGILYTGGPRPLGYIGLGEVFVLMFFGPIAVAGTEYVQTLQFSVQAASLGLAPGLLSSAILVVNNLRDIHTDRVSGKNTLAVRFGKTFARWEYTLFVLVAFAIPWVHVSSGNLATEALLSSLAILPAGFLAWRVWHEEGRTLNPRLGQTGAVMVAFSVLFCVGVFWSS